MFQRALICTDFTDGLYRLTHFVPDLAAGGLKQIVFFHAIPISEEREIPRIDEAKIAQARDRLRAGIKDVPNGVEVKVEVRVGKPADNILKVAQANNSDLIVLGMPTRSVLTERLFGSTTLGLCQRNIKPVLILRPQLISAYTTEELALRCRHLNRYFLLPYNGTEASDMLVAKVKQCVQQNSEHSLECCLLSWIFEEQGMRNLPPKYSEAEARQKLESAKQELTQIGLKVETELRQGEPIMGIMNAALEHDISSILVTSKQNWLQWSVRGFAEELLRSSWHPVLYLPTDK
jgi:nucleotide-binding universal stress UspA family protein